MSRGRDKFNRYKKILFIAVRFLNIFPYKMRVFLFKFIRNLDGNLGLILRYICIKSLAKKCGDNVSIHTNVIILSIKDLELGNNVSIHPFSYIDATGKITIGNDVSIAHASTIMSTEHNYSDKRIPIKDQGVKNIATVVHDNVWIASGVRVLAGSIINSGTIIAAGAIVKNELKGNSIYGGIPAKHLKDR